MNYLNTKPLLCDIEIPVSSNPANCDALPCGYHADLICECCGLALCSSCEVEFPCPHSKNGKHYAASEFALYSGRIQPNYTNPATYRKASIQAAKAADFRNEILSILRGGTL